MNKINFNKQQWKTIGILEEDKNIIVLDKTK